MSGMVEYRSNPTRLVREYSVYKFAMPSYAMLLQSINNFTSQKLFEARSLFDYEF